MNANGQHAGDPQDSGTLRAVSLPRGKDPVCGLLAWAHPLFTVVLGCLLCWFSEEMGFCWPLAAWATMPALVALCGVMLVVAGVAEMRDKGSGILIMVPLLAGLAPAALRLIWRRLWSRRGPRPSALLLCAVLAASALPARAENPPAAPSFGSRLLQGGKTVLKHIVEGPEPLSPDEGKLTVQETTLAIVPTNVPLTELLISPDQRRVAYIDKQAAGAMVVVNGKAGPFYDEIGSLTSSPDSKRLMYEASDKDGTRAVVDGVAEPAIGLPRAQDESSAELWRGVQVGLLRHEGEVRVVLVFDGPTNLQALAVRDRTVLLLEMRIGGS